MAKEAREGDCHICGTYGKLTFEHVPPKKAFNKYPVVLAEMESVLKAGLDPITKGKIQQKGVGDYTLCEKCNNDTGAWYGNDYVSWARQNMRYRHMRKFGYNIDLPYYIYPLRVIKQIVCMFLSTNNKGFGDKNEYLRRFVLNRELQNLPPEIKIYTYIVSTDKLRQTGISVLGRFHAREHKSITLSEIAFPPVGYVMTIDSDSPDDRLLDISHFAKYRYGEWSDVFLNISFLPVHLFAPGDYRTKEKIMKDYETNIKREYGDS